MTTWEFMLATTVSVVFGVSVGRLIGHWEMRPIIDSYKQVAEDYKELVYKEREIRNNMVKEYKKLIEILKKHDLG
jgi:hypothetical protein